jgi:uncharacterized membrane-anchored protein
MALTHVLVAARALVLACALVLAPGAPATAQTAPQPTTPEAKEAEVKAAWADAEHAGTNGPAPIKLLDQASLALPPGHLFVPAPQAARVLRAYGNSPGADLVGLIAGTGPEDGWLTVVRFVREGYIKDDDAKDWNADELLENLRQGTEEANKVRADKGFPEVEIVGWVEKPAYDAGTHRLVWSLSSRHRGEPESAGKGVNYNTYALGREGYFSLNLLTSLDRVEAVKPVARTLLAALGYDQGKRYEDFNASTDKVAAYGLAALVGVVAAKKLGLLALGLALAAKFGKLGILAVAALGAGIVRLFRRGGGKAEA